MSLPAPLGVDIKSCELALSVQPLGAVPPPQFSLGSSDSSTYSFCRF